MKRRAMTIKILKDKCQSANQEGKKKTGQKAYEHQDHLQDDHLAGANRNQFVCADPDGRILWSSGKETRFGMGPFMAVGDRFLILDDDATLTMARADASGFKVMAKARLFAGKDAYAPFAFSGTRLILRDDKRMMCVELGRR